MLRLLPERFQQLQGRGFCRLDFAQAPEILVRALHDVHRRGRLALAVAVAAAGGLNDAVHAGGQTDDTREGNVHAGLDHLSRYADHFFVICARGVLLIDRAQRVLQHLQCLPPVGDAHGG